MFSNAIADSMIGTSSNQKFKDGLLKNKNRMLKELSHSHSKALVLFNTNIYKIFLKNSIRQRIMVNSDNQSPRLDKNIDLL